MKLLLAHKANPKEDNVDGDTPLTLALKRLSPLNMTYSSCALAILNAGANINAQNQLGLAALHYVAKNGMVKWVELLLKRGAKKDIRDQKGLSPYDVAVRQRKTQCAKLLEPDAT